MATRCPICGIPWATPVACCPCGFAPAAMDGFVVRLRLERRRGFIRQLYGAAACASLIPFTWMIGLGSAWWIVLPFVAALVATGTIQVVRGAHAVRQSTRRLRAARRIRQLPVARVVDPKP